MREFTVNANDGGQRLDKFISKLMPKLPKSMMYKGFRKNCVRLNGKHAKDGSVYVNVGDTVSLYFRDEFFGDDTTFKYVKPDFTVLYEDDNIIVVDKAVGLLCHADENGGGTTLIDMIKSYLCDSGEYIPTQEQTFKPALCNRLDRNTGGIVVAAKNAAALREMNDSIKNRRLRKFYTAVAEGYTPQSGTINSQLTRHGRVTAVSGNGKDASLSYTVKAQKDGYSLLEIELHTGRTHQIRVQLSALGYPLAGDTKYGGHGNKYRQALYSTRIVFSFDPDSPLGYLNGMEITAKAPFENDF